MYFFLRENPSADLAEFMQIHIHKMKCDFPRRKTTIIIVIFWSGGEEYIEAIASGLRQEDRGLESRRGVGFEYAHM
jgi:hypothetical protein